MLLSIANKKAVLRKETAQYHNNVVPERVAAVAIHLRRHSIGLSSFIFSCGSERRRVHFETACVTVVQDHRRLLISIPIESHMQFSINVNSNIGLILPHFRDIQYQVFC